MTGIDIYNKAIMLLGYNGIINGENNSDELRIRALDIINNICIDLRLSMINSLADEIIGDIKKLDALCTGTAMLLSLLEGDSNKNVIFTGLYNAKRSIALASYSKVQDVLPYDDGGVD